MCVCTCVRVCVCVCVCVCVRCTWSGLWTFDEYSVSHPTAADGQGNVSIYQYDPDGEFDSLPHRRDHNKAITSSPLPSPPLPTPLSVPDTFGGRRLLRRCDLNSGTLFSSLFRLRCQPSVPPGGGGGGADPKRAAAEKRHVTYFGKWCVREVSCIHHPLTTNLVMWRGGRCKAKHTQQC